MLSTHTSDHHYSFNNHKRFCSYISNLGLGQLGESLSEYFLRISHVR